LTCKAPAKCLFGDAEHRIYLFQISFVSHPALGAQCTKGLSFLELHMVEQTSQTDSVSFTSHLSQPVLALGKVVATPGALALLELHGLSPLPFLVRHAHGDYGTVCADDVQANRDALRDNSRLLSCYAIGDGPKADRLWVITDAGHLDAGHLHPGGSVTTLLLPSEY